MNAAISNELLGLDGQLPQLDGYDWLRHLSLSCIKEDRQDHIGSHGHIKSAARTFVAHLQELAEFEVFQLFRIEEDSIAQAIDEITPALMNNRVAIQTRAIKLFQLECRDIIISVCPSLEQYRHGESFNLIANAFLNSVEYMEDGAGVYFTRSKDDHRNKDVSVYEAKFNDHIVQKRAVANAVLGYAASVLMDIDSGLIELSSEELKAIEYSSAIAKRLQSRNRIADVLTDTAPNSGAVSILPAGGSEFRL